MRLNQEMLNKISFWLVLISIPIAALLFIREDIPGKIPLFMWAVVNLIFWILYDPNDYDYNPISEPGEMFLISFAGSFGVFIFAFLFSAIVSAFNIPSEWWNKPEYKNQITITPLKIHGIAKTDSSDGYRLVYSAGTKALKIRTLSDDEYSLLKTAKKDLRCSKQNLNLKSNWISIRGSSVIVCETPDNKFIIR